MSETEKDKLLTRMAESHSALLVAAENLDLELTLHQDTGWRGRDVLSHIGAWDREVARALDLFASEEVYLIPDFDEDRFNIRTAALQHDWTTEQVVRDWKLARKELIETMGKLPATRFSEEMRYPWGDERGSAARLVGYFYDHDLEHKQEFESFIKGNDSG